MGRGRKGKYSKVRRLIDDWIFLCCFVGNDFLPHLPSLSIHEGAIDTLVSIYHRMLPQLGGYLTDSGNLNVQRVKMLLGALGKLEDKVFRDRHEGVFNKKKKQRQEKLAARGVKDRDLSAKQLFEKTQRAHIDEIRVLPKVDDHASVDPETPLDPAADGPPVDIQGGQPPAQDGERPAEAGAVARKGQKASDEETEEESVEAVPVVQPGVKMSAFARQLAEKAEKARAKRLKKKKKKAQKRSRSPESQAPRVGMVGHSTGQRKRKESPEDAAMEDVTLPAEAGFMDVEVAGKPAPGGRHGERDGGMRDGGKAKKEDEVRLWEDGWKDRYYHVKLKASAGDGDFLRSISNAYIEGLAWVLRYYYHGCPSWEWFYPYHYVRHATP